MYQSTQDDKITDIGWDIIEWYKFTTAIWVQVVEHEVIHADFSRV